MSEEKVLESLKKAMTSAQGIHEPDVMVEVLVDILDAYLYFYDIMPQVRP